MLPSGWETPQKFRERLGAKVGRQRAMFADGHLLLVLHAPPKPDDRERVARLFWRSPSGDWISNAFGKGKAALARHVDEYADIIDHLDREEEAAKSADEFFAILERLTPVHRAARNLRWFGDLMDVVGIAADADPDTNWPLFVIWKPLTTTDQRYHFSARLVGPDGSSYGQSDGVALVPELWREGDTVYTRLLMPPVDESAVWTVDLLLYSWPEIANVPVAGDGGVIMKLGTR